MATAQHLQQQQQHTESGFVNVYDHHNQQQQQQDASNMMNGQYELNAAFYSSYANNSNNNNHHHSNWNQYYQYHHQQQHQNAHLDHNTVFNDHFRQNRFSIPYTYQASSQFNIDNNYDYKKYQEAALMSCEYERKRLAVDPVCVSSYSMNTPSPIPIQETTNDANVSTVLPMAAKKRKQSPEIVTDAPALRALLTNPSKKLKYSPTYFQNGKATADSSFFTATQAESHHGISNSYQYWNGYYNTNSNPQFLSPNKTDDSLDYVDFAAKNNTMDINGSNAIIPMQNVPSGMTCNNFGRQFLDAASPQSRFVDSISTPPLSPNEDEQTTINFDKSAISSPDNKSGTWLQNEPMCKYILARDI